MFSSIKLFLLFYFLFRRISKWKKSLLLRYFVSFRVFWKKSIKRYTHIVHKKEISFYLPDEWQKMTKKRENISSFYFSYFYHFVFTYRIAIIFLFVHHWMREFISVYFRHLAFPFCYRFKSINEWSITLIEIKTIDLDSLREK